MAFHIFRAKDIINLMKVIRFEDWDNMHAWPETIYGPLDIYKTAPGDQESSCYIFDFLIPGLGYFNTCPGIWKLKYSKHEIFKKNDPFLIQKMRYAKNLFDFLHGHLKMGELEKRNKNYILSPKYGQEEEEEEDLQ